MKPTGIVIENPIECTIIRRLNRFVVEVEVEGGRQRACTNNTGRLRGYLFEGNRGFCTRNTPPLKTAYRLFAVREGDLGAVIDTQLQMRAFEKSLATGLIHWLAGCLILRRNAQLGDSVIDYLLGCAGRRVYLEVKSAVMREGRYAMYPDCPSARGRRHIIELMRHQAAGGTAKILFIAALPGVTAFKPSRAGDPEMHRLLTEARGVGVDLRALALLYNPRDQSVYVYNPDLPVEL